jgi:hypothetical protein
LHDNRFVSDWSADWEKRKQGRDCAMCAEGRPDETDLGIRVMDGDWSDAYLRGLLAS